MLEEKSRTEYSDARDRTQTEPLRRERHGNGNGRVGVGLDPQRVERFSR